MLHRVSDLEKPFGNAVHAACIGEKRNVYRILVGESKGKGPLERPRDRWENNTKMSLKEIWLEGVKCPSPVQDRNVSGCSECCNEPLGSVKCKKSLY
jgi:hypothetical protein